MVLSIPQELSIQFCTMILSWGLVCIYYVQNVYVVVTGGHDD